MSMGCIICSSVSKSCQTESKTTTVTGKFSKSSPTTSQYNKNFYDDTEAYLQRRPQRPRRPRSRQRRANLPQIEFDPSATAQAVEGNSFQPPPAQLPPPPPAVPCRQKPTTKNADKWELDLEELAITFRIERYMQEGLPPMPRSSSPSHECMHCSHNHMKKCCLYVGDSVEYAIGYAHFVANIEYPAQVIPRRVSRIPEALSGNFSPPWYPKYTYKYPKHVLPPPPQCHQNENHPPAYSVWIRPCLWPLLGVYHGWSECDSNRLHSECGSSFQAQYQCYDPINVVPIFIPRIPIFGQRYDAPPFPL